MIIDNLLVETVVNDRVSSKAFPVFFLSKNGGVVEFRVDVY